MNGSILSLMANHSPAPPAGSSSSRRSAGWGVPRVVGWDQGQSSTRVSMDQGQYMMDQASILEAPAGIMRPD